MFAKVTAISLDHNLEFLWLQVIQDTKIKAIGLTPNLEFRCK